MNLKRKSRFYFFHEERGVVLIDTDLGSNVYGKQWLSTEWTDKHNFSSAPVYSGQQHEPFEQ